MPKLKAAMRIVTVAALHEAFIHAVMKGASELLLNLQVAAVAQLWPFVLPEELTFLGVMRAMAVRAPNVVL